MSDIITDCLNDRWAMFYTPSMPVDQLTSVQTLEKSIELVNQTLEQQGAKLTQWSAGMQDEIARLLWVNWIYSRLDVEPIRKPILTHYVNNKFYVDCGDTRLMSLRLYDPKANVPVLATCDTQDQDQFSTWTKINNSLELKSATGFGQDAVVLATPAVDWCLYWLEIGDHTTSHHLHSIDQRLTMMQRYLDQQPISFKFSVDWVKETIHWANLPTND